MPICPDCNGVGHRFILCTTAKHRGEWIYVDCMRCDGKKTITKEQEYLYEIGQQIREDRQRRNYNLRDEAEAIGVGPYVLDQIENGKAPREHVRSLLAARESWGRKHIAFEESSDDSA